ncbi:MAG TPA: PorP/SprF family type IX secretion system membrane protein [Ferruginibacter sp.]|nr:PorP/SprF family type IX secretion system membrane protein [Ferruginibacter sp.]HMP22051.1 PorP/SprF family type IX secretion system membrane protein [Ferruginibacter sp.]
MKTKVTLLLCSIAVTSFTQKALSQDIHFSQFYEAPLLRNPALAGIFSGDMRLQAVYRNQWQSVTVPFQTTSFNGEFKLPVGKGEDFMTIGGQFLHDKAGTVALTTTHILPALNYHKSLSAERNTYLSLGFMGGLAQRRLDRSKMTTNSQYDGNGYNGDLSDGETFTRNSYSYLDATVGMSFNSQVGDNEDNNVFAGVAYHHFNKPSNITFYGDNKSILNPKWVFSGGARLSMTEDAYTTLYADYIVQGAHTQIIAGGLITKKLDDIAEPSYLVHGGLFYRLQDAIIPVAKLEARPLAISVSYDVNISRLSAASRGRGGFELALSYQKYLNRDNSTQNAVRCPRF